MTINEFLNDTGARDSNLVKQYLRERDIDEHGDTDLNNLPADVKKGFIACLDVYGYFNEGAGV